VFTSCDSGFQTELQFEKKKAAGKVPYPPDGRPFFSVQNGLERNRNLGCWVNQILRKILRSEKLLISTLHIETIISTSLHVAISIGLITLVRSFLVLLTRMRRKTGATT